MAKNALPLLLLAGGAAVMMAKKKKRKKSKGLPSLEEGEAAEEEEDIEEEPEEKPPSKTPTIPPKEPTPTPDPEIEPQPTPEPTPPMPDPTPGPSDPKRPMGPSGVGSCANAIYNRATEYIDPGIAGVLNQDAMTAWPDAMYYFYIRRSIQTQLYNAVANRFLRQVHEEEPRTLGPIILREELQKIAPSCGWDGDIDKKDEPTKLVWDDAKKIATLAAMMTGFQDPAKWQLFKTSKRFTVTRESLNMPDPGFINAPADKQIAVDQRVEIIATQDSTLENAEHLIGKVTKTEGPNGENDQFEIRIVGTFQGKDVAPKLTEHHGFKYFKSNDQGSNAYFSKAGPTGVYRIYPVGAQ